MHVHTPTEAQTDKQTNQQRNHNIYFVHACMNYTPYTHMFKYLMHPRISHMHANIDA